MYPETNPKRFIIWGLRSSDHTHSYIHRAIYHTLLKQGINVEWVDDKINSLTDQDFTDTVFLTEGQCDKFIPIHPNSFYIIHNVNQDKYKCIPEKQKLVIQVYTTDVIGRQTIPIKGHKYHFLQPDYNLLYLCWASDMMPIEIDNQIALFNQRTSHNNKALFVGSCGAGQFGNINEINHFRSGLYPLTLDVKNMHQDKVVEEFSKYRIAPTLVGTWQKHKEYIPCRIFKTITYGHLGFTNSKSAYDIIGDSVIYDSDENRLAKKAVQMTNEFSLEYKERVIQGMKVVRDKHTYVNRLYVIQEIFKLKNNIFTEII